MNENEELITDDVGDIEDVEQEIEDAGVEDVETDVEGGDDPEGTEEGSDFDPWSEFAGEPPAEEPPPGNDDEAALLGRLAKRGYTILPPDGEEQEDTDPYESDFRAAVQREVSQALAPIMAQVTAQQQAAEAQLLASSLGKKHGMSDTAQQFFVEQLTTAHNGAFLPLVGMAKGSDPSALAVRELLEGLAIKTARQDAQGKRSDGSPVPRRVSGSPVSGRVDAMDDAEKSALSDLAKQLGIKR